MRLQGKITRWDDERGFGFISWHGDGSKVFVHIKAFSGTSRRPKIGDIVSYELAKGRGGKTRADRVRFSGQRQPSKPSDAPRQSGSLPVILTALFVCALIISAYFDRISWLVVIAYAAMSLVTFLAYGWDKSSARLGNRRTPESTLHLMDLIGGWPGGLVAQRLLRHKSRKEEFLAVYWATVWLNVAAVAYLVWRDDAGFIK